MSQYYYLVSSLPMLDLHSVPVMDSREFMDSCEPYLKDQEMEKLSSLLLIPSEIESSTSFLTDWCIWETKLRNTILGHRNKADIDGPEKFLREEKDFFSEINKGVPEAFSKSPSDREDQFDRIRWAKLEDLELGHDFDFTRLCIYKLKLMLCEKRLDRNKAKGSLNYDDVVSEIYGVDPLSPPQIEENVEDN